MTSLKIYCIKFEAKVFGVTTSATYEIDDDAKSFSYITQKQEINLSGQLFFGVAPSKSTTKKLINDKLTMKILT